MIKRLIGILVVVAVVVIIVVAAVRRHNFRSMVLRDEQLNEVGTSQSASSSGLQPAEPAPGEVVLTDTMTVEVIDSL